MHATHPTLAPADAGVTDRLCCLEAAVGALSHEVTTRRLVVTDAHGHPRITAEVAGEVAELTVALADTPPGHGTAVICFAAPEDPGTELSFGVGLQCRADGECVRQLDAYGDAAGGSLAGPPPTGGEVLPP